MLIHILIIKDQRLIQSCLVFQVVKQLITLLVSAGHTVQPDIYMTQVGVIEVIMCACLQALILRAGCLIGYRDSFECEVLDRLFELVQVVQLDLKERNLKHLLSLEFCIFLLQGLHGRFFELSDFIL